MNRAVDGKELELLMAGWSGSQFETFCNALLLADAPTPLKHFPRLSDRGNVPDGGIDAELDYDGPVPTRLLTPGLNIFQFKLRSPYNSKQGLQSISRKVPAELAKLCAAQTMARYTLVTNLNLSGNQQADLLSKLRKVCPPELQVEVLAAGGLAAIINNHNVLKATFFPTDGEVWQHQRARHDRLMSGPSVFIGRDRELRLIEDFLQNLEARLLVVSGPAGIGKSALLLNALEPYQTKALFLRADTPDSRQKLRESSKDLILVVDDVSSGEIERWTHASLANLVTTKAIIVTRSAGPFPKDARLRRIALGPLNSEEAKRLLDSGDSGLTWNQRDWVTVQSGGFPISLVLASRLDAQQLDSTRTIYENLIPAWEAEVRSSLGPEAWTALQLASLMAAFSADPDDGELEALAAALGYATAGLSASVPKLEAFGCFEKIGKLLRIRPNFLAELLAERLLGKGQNDACKILVHLNQPASDRFLERLLSLDTPGASRIRKTLLTDPLNLNRNLLIRLAEKEPEAVLAYVLSNEPPPDIFWLQRLLQFPSTALDALQLLRSYVLSDSSQDFEHLYLIQFNHHWPSALSLDSRLAELQQLQHHPALLWRALAATLNAQDLFVYDVPWANLAPPPQTFTRSEQREYASGAVALATANSNELNGAEIPTALHFFKEASGFLSSARALQLLEQLAQKSTANPELRRLLGVTLDHFIECFPGESGFASLKKELLVSPDARLQWWLDSERLLEFEDYEDFLAQRTQAFGALAKEFAQDPNAFTSDLAASLASDHEGRMFLEHLGRECPKLFDVIPIEGWSAFLNSFELELKRQLLQDSGLWKKELARPFLLELLARCPVEDWSQSLLVQKATDKDTPIKELRAAGFWRWPLQPALWFDALIDRPKLAGWLLEWMTDPVLETELGSQLAWKCLQSNPPPWLAKSVRKIQCQRVAARLAPQDPARAISIFIEGLRSERRTCGRLPIDDLASGPFFQSLMETAPTEFVAGLFELVGEKSFSMFHFSQELRRGLASEHQQILLDYAATHPEQVAAVAYCLDSNSSDFWNACDTLLALRPGDTEVEACLFAALTRSGESFWGEESNRLRGFLEQISEPMKRHPSARVRKWLVNVQRSLDNDLQRKLVWEYDFKSREFEQSLAASNTPAQKWALKRLVEHGNFQDVRRLVSPELLAKHLPELDLPPTRKLALEKALEFWTQDVG